MLARQGDDALDQPGFSDARLARDDQTGTTTLMQTGHSVGQDCDLAVASD
jgi:hypothetical protein